MSTWLIVLVTLIYVYVAAEQGMRGNGPLCVVYAGYAFANVGLVWLAALTAR